LKTCTQLLQNKGQQLSADILRNANIDIRETSYDNWNGGQYGFTLNLQVPLNLYSKIEDDIESIEKNLLNKLSPMIRNYDNQYLEKIIINPKLY
jgi:hypothetical protein